MVDRAFLLFKLLDCSTELASVLPAYLTIPEIFYALDNGRSSNEQVLPRCALFSLLAFSNIGGTVAKEARGQASV